MTTKPGLGQVVAGVGGGLLLVSLVLPWASADGVERSGWELLTMADVFLMIVGLVAIGTPLTGGFRGLSSRSIAKRGGRSACAGGDLSDRLAADLRLPGGSREVGVFLALVAAIVIAAGVDYRPLRGAPWFPRLRSHQDSAS